MKYERYRLALLASMIALVFLTTIPARADVTTHFSRDMPSRYFFWNPAFQEGGSISYVEGDLNSGSNPYAQITKIHIQYYSSAGWFPFLELDYIKFKICLEVGSLTYYKTWTYHYTDSPYRFSPWTIYGVHVDNNVNLRLYGTGTVKLYVWGWIGYYDWMGQNFYEKGDLTLAGYVFTLGTVYYVGGGPH